MQVTIDVRDLGALIACAWDDIEDQHNNARATRDADTMLAVREYRKIVRRAELSITDATKARCADAIVTDELIDRLRTGQGGWKRSALAYLGVAWPPSKGWKHRIRNKPRKPLSPHESEVPDAS